MHKRYAVYILVCLFLIISVSIVGAQEAAPDYLKYQEPQPTSVSFLSTISYVFSLLVTFAVIIGLAFYTSRFMGKKMGGFNNSADGKVMSSLALSPKGSVYIVEIAGKYLILGVTEHSINILQEITNEEEIAVLKQREPINPSKSQFEVLFQNHIHSLREMSNKFPVVFGAHQNTQENEGEKR